MVIVISFYGILLGRYIYKMRTFSFELPKSKTVLVIGDSQTQADINDSICTNVKNISLAHDGYFTMYKRLQLYVEANPQIDMVIVALSPHTVSPVKDEFYHNFGYIDETVKHYIPYFSVEDWWLLLRSDPEDVLASLITPIKYYLTPSADKIREMGYYDSADYSHLEDDIKGGAVRLIPDSCEVNYGNSITLQYLHKIEDYCSAKKISLIGINTPVLCGEKYFDMNNYTRLLLSEFCNITIWDYMNFKIDNNCRRDVNHLNKKGAIIFSHELKKKIKINSLDKMY